MVSSIVDRTGVKVTVATIPLLNLVRTLPLCTTCIVMVIALLLIKMPTPSHQVVMVATMLASIMSIANVNVLNSMLLYFLSWFATVVARIKSGIVMAFTVCTSGAFAFEAMGAATAVIHRC